MSSTHRGAVRAPNDSYPTPGWCTRAILPFLPLDGRILEPACGAGAIVRELRAAGVRPEQISVIDIAPAAVSEPLVGLASEWWADFTTWCVGNERAPRFDLIITNPPYALAEVFVRRALELRTEKGVVAMLLRLNFLGSQKRAAWLRANTPSVYVLPRRPSFTGHGTDSCEYAWMVWSSAPPTVKILEVPPC